LLYRVWIVLSLTALLAVPAAATPFFFSTGNPDGLMATLGRVGSPAGIQTETADDFVLTQSTRLTSATFTGLIPLGTPLSSISQVEIEFYHVFPKDSDVSRTSGPPTFSTSQVPTRVNSPGDVEIASATRDSLAGTLSFTPGIVSSSFTVNNSVVNGINPTPNQFTGGEGSVTGQEVTFNIIFSTPVDLAADHYFFRPEVLLSNGGDFLWLSAPKPIVPPGTPFPPGFTDLQTWIRNDNLAPDWLRIGTDITGQGPFNAAFSLSGTAVPEPATWGLLVSGLGALAAWRRKLRF
jgi:PEP-CTERM motif-containing protein